MYFANCTSDPGLCKEQGVTGFPTLHAFRNLGWMDGDECFTKHTTNKIKYIRQDYHGVLRVKNIKYLVTHRATLLVRNRFFRVIFGNFSTWYAKYNFMRNDIQPTQGEIIHPETRKIQKTVILTFYKFSDVWFNLTFCGLNLNWCKVT